MELPEEAGSLRIYRIGKSSRCRGPGAQTDSESQRPIELGPHPSSPGKGDSGVFSIEEDFCVWMRARVINFKLCDRTYDCLNCAFDKAMSEAWSRGPRDGDQ